MSAHRSPGPPAQSRLARMLERLTTQRACLEFAVEAIATVPGAVLEIGLGKGRTYDHLRRLLPGREILVFDREVHAIKDCIPPMSSLYLGDFLATLPTLLPIRAGGVALVHADLGSEDLQRDRSLVRRLGPTLQQLLAPGAILLSDRPFEVADWQALPQPPTVGTFDYYLYRSGH